MNKEIELKRLYDVFIQDPTDWAKAVIKSRDDKFYYINEVPVLKDGYWTMTKYAYMESCYPNLKTYLAWHDVLIKLECHDEL
jgi:hypothetical protein